MIYNQIMLYMNSNFQVQMERLSFIFLAASFWKLCSRFLLAIRLVAPVTSVITIGSAFMMQKIISVQAEVNITFMR